MSQEVYNNHCGNLKKYFPPPMSLLQIIVTVSTIVSVLLTEFSKLYESLGVRITERGESFYQPLMPQVVKDLEAKSSLPS